VSSITLLKTRSRKKAVMGIETLIIFIAMIIVAAIAAGVLLRTQGVLQQRALAVGTETQERIVTGVEVLTVVGYVNTTAATINEFEATVRPSAGSDPVQLLTMGITVTTQTNFLPLVLEDTLQQQAHSETFTFLNASQHLMSYNMNYDPNDYSSSYVALVTGNLSPDNLSGLNITTVSTAGVITNSFVFPLGINFTNVSQVVNYTNMPIYQNPSDIFSPMYGYLTLQGSPAGSAQISTAQNFTKFMIQSDVDNLCDWNNLVPDYRFCYRVRLGNQNTVIETGEIMSLRFKMSDSKAVTIDQTVDMQFVPKGGNLQDIVVYIPQVLTKAVQTLWP